MLTNDIASLLHNNGNSRWSGSGPLGTAAVVTFSFPTAAASYLLDDEKALVEKMTDGQQVHVRAALDEWAKVGGITFVEVPNSVGGDLQFQLYDMSDDPSLAGFAYLPGNQSLVAESVDGDVFMNKDYYSRASDLAPGSEGFTTLLHEIGHAIGFKHPFEGSPTITPARDNGAFTVLSYDIPTSQVAVGAVDKAAIQYLYGTASFAGSWNAQQKAVVTTATEADDLIYGWRNNDIVYAKDGNDTVHTGGGKDVIHDGSGNDTVKSGAGDDYFRVGGGQDDFDGGSGNDYISYYDSANGVSVNLTTNVVSGSWAVNDTIKSFEKISGSKTGDDMITGTSGANIVRTYGGDDKVFAKGGADKVELGAGDDFVRVGGGREAFDGGTGHDYISYYASANGIRIDLRDDKVSGSWAVNDTIKDFESASGSKTGADMMLGTIGDNTLRAYGGNDTLFGRGGSDKLYGGDGADFLDGGGGSGTDMLYGGAGADVFNFDKGEGIDVIKDFENNVDLIELDNFSMTKEQALALATQSGDDVIFDFGADGMLTVEDATIGQLVNDLAMV